MSQFHFRPETYLELIREEVPRFDDLQDAVAAATAGADVERALELGTGTGETAKRVLELHPRARLTGIDASAEMLEAARREVDPARVEALEAARLEDPLPPGPFDLVFSNLAVHHLDAPGKRTLFRRVATVLRPGGRFVLGDVIVPERPADAVTPCTPGFDLPDRPADLLAWLEEAGLLGELVWQWKDLAVIAATRPPS